jgi:uncharacterized protein DUF6600/FecR-like protein
LFKFSARGWFASIVVCLPFSSVPNLADYSQPTVMDATVPARIRALEGAATVQREREQDRIAATVNTPIYPGDRIDAGDAPLELQLPEGSLIWLDGGARIQILAMKDSSDDSREGTVLILEVGTLEGEVVGEGSQNAEMRIDTPESSVYLMSRGRFRVETSNGTTTVISYRGVVELAGDEGSALVRSGQQSRVESGGEPEEPWPVNTLRRDPFGEWCEERSESYVPDSNSEENAYVEEVPRPERHYVSELDYYGDWRYVPTYGWVWRPTMLQVGWRPYYSGYWTWCHHGWTWVSYEPWGWLPYHYGRWSWLTSAGWVWIPGAVYSGAWVSWAVTPSHVGWCPLDFYNRPAYVSFNYTSTTVTQYGGGWNFLPLNRWGGRNLNRDIVRADRVPRLEAAITTSSLPHFDERQARIHPEVIQHVVRNSSVPLRSSERTPREVSSFRQSDRRETGGAPRVSHPTASAKNGEVPGNEKSAPSARTPPVSSITKGVPTRREFRPVEPMKPRYSDDRGGMSAQRRARPDGQPVDEVRPPSPRVPSTADDPSRRVLNRILKEGSLPQPQLSGAELSIGRSTPNRPRVTSGSRPAPVTSPTQTRSPQKKAAAGAPNRTDKENKQKKDKP